MYKEDWHSPAPARGHQVHAKIETSIEKIGTHPRAKLGHILLYEGGKRREKGGKRGKRRERRKKGGRGEKERRGIFFFFFFFFLPF